MRFRFLIFTDIALVVVGDVASTANVLISLSVVIPVMEQRMKDLKG